jgi:hypothetical protein
MPNLADWSMHRAAGLLLVFGFAANLAGVVMFSIRAGSLGLEPTHGFINYERSVIVAAVVLTALGFAVLEGAFRDSRGHVLARVGATAYLYAGVVLAVAEFLELTLGADTVHGLQTMYVVIAFLAQASIGAALLQSRMVAAWIAWAAILWSMGWLLILPAISPSGIYFPGLHHLAPLVIGIALLRKSPGHGSTEALSVPRRG